MEQVEWAPAGPSSREYGRGALARTRALDLLSPTLVLFGATSHRMRCVRYQPQFCAQSRLESVCECVVVSILYVVDLWPSTGQTLFTRLLRGESGDN